MINFEDKMDKIFEAIEDEENPNLDGLGYNDADEPEVKSPYDDNDDDDGGGDAARDWTNIPNARAGKTLNDLKKVRLPLENGWTFDEVVSAMKPSLIFTARRYSTPNFGQDEAFLSAMEGVWDAIRTDKGMAPFTTHAYRTIGSRVKRASAGTKDFPTANVSGIKPNVGGAVDFLKSVRSSVSADTPVDDSEGGQQTYASRISGDATSGSKEASRQLKTSELLHALFGSEEVGLTDNEEIVMLATYGISRSGSFLPDGPRSTKQIADSFGVSNVRVSQMRKNAQKKIKNYFDSAGIESEEDAMVSLGLEEAKMALAAKMVLESLPEILRIDIELVSEHIKIPVNFSLNGAVRHAIAMVNSDTMMVDDVVAEGNESILIKTPEDIINEAKYEARIKLSKEYYSEIVESIIGIFEKPVLAVLGVKPQQEEEEQEQED